MNKFRLYTAAFLLGLISLIPVPVQAQLTIGQYEDEAPFRTWNTFGIPTAAATAMGETQFAIVADASAAVINPARLTSIPRFSCSLNGSYTAASLDKYGVVNTGVLFTEGNSAMGLYALDFAGITFHLGGWSFGIDVGLFENYDRPSQSPDYVWDGELQYRFQYEQSGHLRNYNVALAREWAGWLSFGIGLNYVAGSMERSVVENMFYNGVTISDQKKHDFTGFYVNAGMAAEVNEKLTLAAVFRTPYTKQADSESRLRYDSTQANMDIRIDAEAGSSFAQPLVLGAGVDYRFSPKIRAAADLSYFRWSSYSVTYFEESIQREFKDIVKIAAGMEYAGSFRLFGEDFRMPLRAGVSYDPQPIERPGVRYFYFSVGIGLHWQRLRLDAGAMFGKEKGSGGDLYGRKLAVTVGYHL